MIALAELADAARAVFPPDALMPPRDASWAQVVELGFLLTDLAEADGGLALGRPAVATILLEMARALPAAPLATALLGLEAVAASALPARGEWIARIIGGDYIPLHLAAAQVTRDGAALSGTLPCVFEADMASHALAGLGDAYLLVPLDAPGVHLVEHRMWDESRRLCDVVLDGFTPAPDLLVAEGEAARALHDRLAITAQLAVAADCLGGAQALLAMTVEYLGTRRQFDRPLAMFQALKHRVADLKVALSGAEALFWSALAGEPTPLAMGAMKAHCAAVYLRVAEEAIQLHGGIGLTEEHACHRFFKRAMLNAQLCGSVDYWEERAGRELLGTKI